MARRSRWNRHQPLPVPEEEKLKFSVEEYWKAKHTKQPLDSKIVLIKCLGGKIHKIKLDFPGRVTLLNHPSKQEDIIMQKLGGDKPECVKFLEDWKSNPNNCAYNRPLVKRYWHMRTTTTALKSQALNNYQDWLNFPLAGRLATRIENMKATLFEKIRKKLLPLEKQEQRYYDSDYFMNYRLEKPSADYICTTVPFKFEFSELKTKEEKDGQ